MQGLACPRRPLCLVGGAGPLGSGPGRKEGPREPGLWREEPPASLWGLGHLGKGRHLHATSCLVNRCFLVVFVFN